ncbi:MAG: DNA repair protein RecN [Clostridiales bacterium]|nr:DNA repair protein RecN [Clostridiales bacterium]
MLVHLSVKNLALIDEIELVFDKGLNILTGETGAGKSIIIDAVNLVLGERADRDLIQTGKEYALVEAVFDLGDQPNFNEILSEYGIKQEQDNSLLLMRELSVSGRNICRINGRIVTLSVLKSIGSYLVDIHGQHQHQSLLIVDQHRELLDKLGGKTIASLKELVNKHYNKWKAIQKKIQQLSGSGMDIERRKDILSYQINEIESAALELNEDEDLRKERGLLIHAEKITNIINSVYQDIYSGSDNHSPANDLIGRCASQLEQIAELEPAFAALSNKMKDLLYQIEDIAFDVREYKDKFEYNPYRLDEVEKRLEIIRSLKRKYGKNIKEIYDYLESVKTELIDLENSQDLLEELLKEENLSLHKLLDASYVLSTERKKIAEYFREQLLGQLADLGMDQASFNVDIDPINHNDIDSKNIATRLSPSGYDIVEFLISANPGEPVKSLSKVASGGELSRIMLAFKTILAKLDDIPTLIFDEIDVGISGQIAHVIGQKMSRISRSRQIICVTHLPQIAVMADSHYKILKQYDKNRTRTTVLKLNNEQRHEEIAKLTDGKDISDISLEHSHELIRRAHQYKTKS